MILDSGSSTHLFCNKDWLRNISHGKTPVELNTNAGAITVHKVGTLPEFGEVPFHQDALTNIVSLAKLSDKYRVTYDSNKEDAFFVHTPEKTVRFARNSANLYAHKPTHLSPNKTTKHYSHLQTVAENMKFHTPREIKKAKMARELLATLGTPSIQDMKTILSMNAIANVPVTTSDVDLAERIFGPDLGTLKGKTTRRKPLPMVSDQIAIPPELYEKRSELELCMDIMFVNEVPYMTSITRALYYRTAQFLPTRTHRDLYDSLDAILRLYNECGFIITKIYCDNEFKTLMDPVKDDMEVTMEYSPPQGHVPEAERNNRTLKERIRATFHRLPYKALPKALMKVLVQESARKLNYFPNKNGLSPYYSPRQIVHRAGLDYNTHCKYAFGSYVQAHDEPDPSRTQAQRSIDAIYLRPVTNGHEVYDLSTQRPITRRSITTMVITPAIIRAVQEIADSEKQHGLRITTKKGITIYDSSWTAGVDYIEDNENDSDDEDEDYEYESEGDETETYTDETSYDEYEAEELLYEEQLAGVQDNQESVQEEDIQGQEEQSDEDTEPEEQPRRSTRQRAPRTIMQPTMQGTSHGEAISQQHLMVEEQDATEYEHDVAQYAVNLMSALKDKIVVLKKQRQKSTKKGCYLVTYSLQKGIKKFQDKGYDSAKGEMKQLHDRDCWKPISVKTMTKSEKHKALESLIFLVEKKCGKIKSRHCANGSKQRDWMNQEETASPTVMTESVMLTATIEAEENRDVATYDIPNAFIQTPVDETDAQGDRIVMKIRGAMIDMLIEIDPSYAEYVTYENGQRILYVHILRAIYGMLMSGLLFYRKFRTSIEKIGYKVNPYDPCVANKTIRGKQHTISWHVDDVKSSHVDPKVNDEFQQWLQEEYGEQKDITATRGKKHVYLGMLLDYSTPGEVKIDMTDYVKDMIDEFPVKLKGIAASPATEKLFNVDQGKKLGSLKAEAFHTFAAKALFLTCRARPDIKLVVAFLCTRVRIPTSYDWIKLIRMMDFLERTKEDCLTLRADGSRTVTWSVDAAFAVHADMKSHSGMTMTMGSGAIYSKSNKQKLNTRSSTEAELVAVDDSMAPVIWTKNFLEAQDYKIKARIILQDNESAIRLECNGHKSVGQRSRHINIRYFFITDQVQKGIVTIEYCPTDEMESDYLTKPLQGFKFTKFRIRIMNLPG